MTRTDEDLIADLVATTKHLGQLLQPGYGAFQLEKLLAIKRWVLASLSIQVGDRVGSYVAGARCNCQTTMATGTCTS